MKESIRKGFGFAIGYIIGASLIKTVSESVNKALEESKKKDQSNSSAEKGEA